MSATVIFIVGAVIFAITVYGAVVAGGLVLTRSELEGDDDLVPEGDEHATPANLPIDVTY